VRSAPCTWIRGAHVSWLSLKTKVVCQWFGIKTTRTVFSGLSLKPVATVFFGSTLKSVAAISAGLTLKPVVDFLVEPQN
jgi:hypothetical protein